MSPYRIIILFLETNRAINFVLQLFSAEFVGVDLARKPCGDTACNHGQQKVERDPDASLPVPHSGPWLLATPGGNGHSLLRSLRFHLQSVGQKGQNSQVDGKCLLIFTCVMKYHHHISTMFLGAARVHALVRFHHFGTAMSRNADVLQWDTCDSMAIF